MITTEREPPSGHRYERGFTLVELVVVLLITSLLIAGAGTIIVLSARVNRSVQANMESSSDAFRTSSLFSDDVAASGAVPDSNAPVSLGETGCENEPSVLRLVGPARGGGVVVRSYTRTIDGTGAKLERRQCSGTTIADAVTAPAAAETVAPDLASGPDAAVASCADAASLPAEDEEGCSRVTLAIATTSGFRFSVTGATTSTRTPTATTAVQPASAPATGTCTIVASKTGWASSGGAVSGSSSTIHQGDPTLLTFNSGNYRAAYLEFDLTGPCSGATDSWPQLPGGRLLTSVELWLTYLGKSTGGGVSRDGHALEALDTTSTWTEPTLNGNTMPTATRNRYSFNVTNPGNPTRHVDAAITSAVTEWYAAGGWPNNGFRLRRSAIGDTLGKSNRFASRFASDPNLRPRLVITWG